MFEEEPEFSEPIKLDIPVSRHPRIAVFGGSFDPIHNGHVTVAREAIRQDLADEVMFVPANQPPHKPDIKLISSKHRMAMLELIVSGNRGFSVTDVELQDEGDTSYTIDTLETLQRAFPDYDLVFIIGMDSLTQLHTWHRASELVHKFDFIVYPRPGYLMPSFSELSVNFGAKLATKLGNSVVDIEPIDIAATEIREMIGKKRSAVDLLPQEIVDYIQDNKLYQQ